MTTSKKVAGKSSNFLGSGRVAGLTPLSTSHARAHESVNAEIVPPLPPLPPLPPETYRLELRPEGNHPAPPIIRLRRALKTLLRSYGLRCTSISGQPAETIKDYSPNNPGTRGSK